MHTSLGPWKYQAVIHTDIWIRMCCAHEYIFIYASAFMWSTFTYTVCKTETLPGSHQAVKHLQRASLKLSVCTSWQTALWSKRTHLLTNGSIQVIPKQIENEIELKQTELIQSEGGELIAGASQRIVVKWCEREFIYSRSFAQLTLSQGPRGIKIASQHIMERRGTPIKCKTFSFTVTVPWP